MEPTNQPNQPSPQMKALIKRVERQTLDSIRVYNPTDEDFILKWNSVELWRFPNKNNDLFGAGKGQRIVPRYIYEHYLIHMTDHILTQESDAYINKINADRESKGMPRLNHKERFELEPRTNDKLKRKSIMKKLFIRIEQEHGVDIEVPLPEEQVIDTRPIDTQLMEEIEKEALQGVKVHPEVPSTIPQTPQDVDTIADVFEPKHRGRPPKSSYESTQGS